MSNRTQYDVFISYKLADGASAGLHGIANAAKDASFQWTSFLHHLQGAYQFLRSGFGAGADALIGFNARVDESITKLTAITQMQMGVPYDRAKVSAQGMFSELQKLAQQTPATTSELVNFAGDVQNAFMSAGGSVKQLPQFAAQAAVAAKMLGMEGTAGLDITQAIQGRVTERDRFAKAMIEGQLNMSIDTFNKKKQSERVKLLASTFDSPAIRDAMKNFESSWAGVTSSFQDTFEILAGQAGRPIFEMVTKEIKSWNVWLEQNKDTVAKIVKDVGDGLVTGFKMVKDGMMFLVDNADTLITVGKVWLALKGVSAVAGMGGGGGGGIGGALGKGGIAGVLGTFSNALVAATAAVGLLDTALKQMDRERDQQIEAGSNRARVAEYGFKYEAGGDPAYLNMLRNVAKDAGAITNEGFLDRRKINEYVGLHEAESLLKEYQNAGWEEKVQEQTKELQRTRAALATLETALIMDADGKRKALASQAFLDEFGNKLVDSFGRRKRKSDTEIKAIIKVEVTSSDPDRFVFGLQNALQKMAENPTQAEGALREIGG